MDFTLDPKDRSKLDGIVQTLLKEGYDDKSIQTVVDDFKQRTLERMTGPMRTVMQRQGEMGAILKASQPKVKASTPLSVARQANPILDALLTPTKPVRGAQPAVGASVGSAVGQSPEPRQSNFYSQAAGSDRQPQALAEARAVTDKDPILALGKKAGFNNADVRRMVSVRGYDALYRYFSEKVGNTKDPRLAQEYISNTDERYPDLLADPMYIPNKTNKMVQEVHDDLTDNPVTNFIANVETTINPQSRLVGKKGFTGHVMGAASAFATTPLDIMGYAANLLHPNATPEMRLKSLAGIAFDAGILDPITGVKAAFKGGKGVAGAVVRKLTGSGVAKGEAVAIAKEMEQAVKENRLAMAPGTKPVEREGRPMWSQPEAGNTQPAGSAVPPTTAPTLDWQDPKNVGTQGIVFDALNQPLTKGGNLTKQQVATLEQQFAHNPEMVSEFIGKADAQNPTWTAAKEWLATKKPTGNTVDPSVSGNAYVAPETSASSNPKAPKPEDNFQLAERIRNVDPFEDTDFHLLDQAHRVLRNGEPFPKDLPPSQFAELRDQLANDIEHRSVKAAEKADKADMSREFDQQLVEWLGKPGKRSAAADPFVRVRKSKNGIYHEFGKVGMTSLEQFSGGGESYAKYLIQKFLDSGYGNDDAVMPRSVFNERRRLKGDASATGMRMSEWASRHDIEGITQGTTDLSQVYLPTKWLDEVRKDTKYALKKFDTPGDPAIYQPHDPMSTSHEDVQAVRDMLDMGEREKTAIPDNELVKKAAEHNPFQVAAKVKAGESVSGDEVIAMGVELQKTRNAMKAAKEAGDDVAWGKMYSSAETLADAIDKAGSDAGRNLRARRILVDDTYDHFGLTRRAEKEAGGAIHPKVQAQLDTMAQRISDLETQLAQRQIKRQPKPLMDRVTEIRARRQQALDDLLKSTSASSGVNYDQFEAGVRYLKTFVEEGVVRVEDLVDHMKKSGVKWSDEDNARAAKKAIGDYARDLNQGRASFGETMQVKGSAGIQDKELAALRAKIDVEKMRADSLVRSLRPRNPATAVLKEGAGAIRAAKLSMDLGALLRQGFLGFTSNPKRWAQAVGKGLKTVPGDEAAMMLSNAINDHVLPDGRYAAPLRKAAGLQLTHYATGEFEEPFAAQWIRKIPGVGQLFAGSERLQSGFLNTLRASMFDDFAAKFPDATPQELQQWASYINDALGRSNLKSVHTAAEVALTSPRWAVSRFGVLSDAVKAGLSPKSQASREIVKEAVKAAGVIYGGLWIAKQRGYDVNLDYTSSDFLKARNGDQVTDFTGAMGPALRLILRVALSKKQGQTPAEELGNYAVQRMSPAVTSAYQSLRGETLTGYQLDEQQKGWQAWAPLIASQWKQNVEQEGFAKGTVKMLGTEMVGVSQQSYPKPKPKPDRKTQR